MIKHSFPRLISSSLACFTLICGITLGASTVASASTTVTPDLQNPVFALDANNKNVNEISLTLSSIPNYSTVTIEIFGAQWLATQDPIAINTTSTPVVCGTSALTIASQNAMTGLFCNVQNGPSSARTEIEGSSAAGSVTVKIPATSLIFNGTAPSGGYRLVVTDAATEIFPINISTTPSPKTVTFDANGGTGTVAAQTASTRTALTSNAFTKTGHTFSGWNTAADGTGILYAGGASYSFAADLTLYAQWRANAATVTPTEDTLASTGFDGAPYLSSAVILTLAGVMSVTLARRRKTR